VGLLPLFDKYAEDKKLTDGETRGGRKSIAAYRACIQQFIELFGDLPLHEITRDIVGPYRSLLVRLPSRGEGIRKLSAQQLIEKADAENLPRVAAPTVLNKLLALSAVLSFGVRMGLMAENPVIQSGIVKAAKVASSRAPGARRRKDYTEDEIRLIFTSPIFSEQGWSSPRTDFGRALYWMPLLLYYTGARREELAQLSVKDVSYDKLTLIPFLSILASPDEDDAGRGVKNEGSRRRIPLHSDLISRGFMDYVHGLPAEGQLFPLMKPGPDGFYGTNFGKRWGNSLRDVVGLKSSASPVHGFRHTFRTLCREVGIREIVADELRAMQVSNLSQRKIRILPIWKAAPGACARVNRTRTYTDTCSV
jgi:integrase